ncbi:hypothetical protein Salat_2665100 [Sesamum alatum]|uniref:Uncharacterized protein n=1 Tax=Sesamum alatum TaxID=300844 RepID=A0AAE2CB25_9LAMI|nr:hypothetical protein Salat_2665100 [Sesamum alatum]
MPPFGATSPSPSASGGDVAPDLGDLHRRRGAQKILLRKMIEIDTNWSASRTAACGPPATMIRLTLATAFSCKPPWSNRCTSGPRLAPSRILIRLGRLPDLG